MLMLLILGPRSRDSYGDDKIKSEVMYAGERRYYLDLKENSRGRFLKVSAVFKAIFVYCGVCFTQILQYTVSQKKRHPVIIFLYNNNNTTTTI